MEAYNSSFSNSFTDRLIYLSEAWDAILFVTSAYAGCAKVVAVTTPTALIIPLTRSLRDTDTACNSDEVVTNCFAVGAKAATEEEKSKAETLQSKWTDLMVYCSDGMR
jgi:hypothetical protein